MERGQLDLMDMRANPVCGYNYIGVYQDHFTKFAIIYPQKTKSAVETASRLFTGHPHSSFHYFADYPSYSDVLSVFGTPKVLQTDNGSEFCNEVLKELLAMFNAKIIHGRPYHPQSQGSVERLNQTISAMLQAWMVEVKKSGEVPNWAVGLKVVQYQYNSR